MIHQSKNKSKIRTGQGQSLMEYIIITSLIGIICLGTVKQIGDSMEIRLKRIKTTLATEIP